MQKLTDDGLQKQGKEDEEEGATLEEADKKELRWVETGNRKAT